MPHQAIQSFDHTVLTAMEPKPRVRTTLVLLRCSFLLIGELGLADLVATQNHVEHALHVA